MKLRRAPPLCRSASSNRGCGLPPHARGVDPICWSRRAGCPYAVLQPAPASAACRQVVPVSRPHPLQAVRRPEFFASKVSLRNTPPNPAVKRDATPAAPRPLPLCSASSSSRRYPLPNLVERFGLLRAQRLFVLQPVPDRIHEPRFPLGQSRLALFAVLNHRQVFINPCRHHRLRQLPPNPALQWDASPAARAPELWR